MSKVFERLGMFVLDDLWDAVVCIKPPSLLIGKVCRGTCDALLCVSHTLQSTLERGQEARLRKLILLQPLLGSIHGVFSISSALWVLEVVCCLDWHSFFQTSHGTLWWMVIWVNWLTLCQGCQGSVLGSLFFLLYTSEFFSILKITLIGYAHFDGYCCCWGPFSVPVERSCWPCIRWCETGGFQEQSQCFFIGLSYSIPFGLLLFFTFSSFCQ